MKKIVHFLFLPLLLLAACQSAPSPSHPHHAVTDSLLGELDRAIASRPQYAAQRYARIDSLQALFAEATTLPEIRNIQEELYLAYEGFQLDSALFYAQSLYGLLANDSDSLARARSLMSVSFVKCAMGLFRESKALLDSLPAFHDTADVMRFNQFSYSIYHQLYSNAIDDTERAAYLDSVIVCQQRILDVMPPGTLSYDITRAALLRYRGATWEALSCLQTAMREHPCRLDEEAILARELAIIYASIGQDENAYGFYAYSALADLRDGKRSYTSLPNLAVLLYESGDVERAYRYILCALDDINFCHSKVGLMQIDTYLPVIISTYSYRAARYQHQQRILMVVIITLSLLLIGMALLVGLFRRRQRRMERLMLERDNQLAEFTERMDRVASELRDANRTKEECIGQVFNLCSVYLDRQDLFSKTVGNMLRSNQSKELLKLVDDKNRTHKDLRELFHSFDVLFLTVYPHFVEDFQGLLRSGETLVIPEGDLLSPELRIYALVRLGINDSVKIAGFLHFTPQTIYNYRQKMRARTDLSKEEFLARIRTL